MSLFIKPGQALSLRNLLDKATGLKLLDDQRLFIISSLIHRNVTQITHVRLEEWQAIRDEAFSNWPYGDWDTLSPDFCKKACEIEQQYREQVLGQRRLFDV